MELGYPRNDDFNGARQEGVGYHQTTTRNGKRCSTAVGYLHPVMQRPNLRVITGALADKVLFEGKRAVGVAFREHGQPRTVRAAREVILCGGATLKAGGLATSIKVVVNAPYNASGTYLFNLHFMGDCPNACSITARATATR